MKILEEELIEDLDYLNDSSLSPIPSRRVNSFKKQFKNKQLGRIANGFKYTGISTHSFFDEITHILIYSLFLLQEI